MLIPIRPADGAGPATWAMIELQGELERKTDANEAFDIGTITHTSQGTVSLHIGYHQLEGKRVVLKKPLAVLSKSTDNDETSYKLIGIVKEKLHFSARPKALITKPVAPKP